MKRVLIVDDNPIIRMKLTEILRKLDYDVDSASNGKTAVDKFIDSHLHSNPFNVIILDLVLENDMSGEDTMYKIRTLDPNAKIIISSGFLTEGFINSHNSVHTDFITKPYQVKMLNTMIEKFA